MSTITPRADRAGGMLSHPVLKAYAVAKKIDPQITCQDVFVQACIAFGEVCGFDQLPVTDYFSRHYFKYYMSNPGVALKVLSQIRNLYIKPQTLEEILIRVSPNDERALEALANECGGEWAKEDKRRAGEDRRPVDRVRNRRKDINKQDAAILRKHPEAKFFLILEGLHRKEVGENYSKIVIKRNLKVAKKPKNPPIV